MANNKINKFVTQELFDPNTHDRRRKNWKKIYLTIDFARDSDNDAIDYLCYIVTFDPKKALKVFDRVKEFQISRYPMIIVYYAPPTFKFKSSNNHDRIREWFELGYPNYVDIETPYNKKSQAKWIQTISIKNAKNTDSLLDMIIAMLRDNPEHWWSYIEERYTKKDLYGVFDDKNFEFIKDKDGVCKKIYSVVGTQTESIGQQLVLTYNFNEAVSKVLQCKNHWGKNNIHLLCHYVPTDAKEIEELDFDEMDILNNEFPDEVYTYYDLERFDLLT